MFLPRFRLCRVLSRKQGKPSREQTNPLPRCFLRRIYYISDLTEKIYQPSQASYAIYTAIRIYTSIDE
jgi:hypothetical protein